MPLMNRENFVNRSVEAEARGAAQRVHAEGSEAMLRLGRGDIERRFIKPHQAIADRDVGILSGDEVGTLATRPAVADQISAGDYVDGKSRAPAFDALQVPSAEEEIANA